VCAFLVANLKRQKGSHARGSPARVPSALAAVQGLARVRGVSDWRHCRRRVSVTSSGMLIDLSDFIADHRPPWNGYLLTLACSCGCEASERLARLPAYFARSLRKAAVLEAGLCAEEPAAVHAWTQRVRGSGRAPVLWAEHYLYLSILKGVKPADLPWSDRRSSSW
jgi:hypothetical protein